MKNKYAKVLKLTSWVQVVMTVVMLAGVLFCQYILMKGIPQVCDECTGESFLSIKILLSLMVVIFMLVLTVSVNVHISRTVKENGTVGGVFRGIVDIILSGVIFLWLKNARLMTHEEDTFLIKMFEDVCKTISVLCIVLIVLNVANMVLAYLFDKEKWRLIREEKQNCS